MFARNRAPRPEVSSLRRGLTLVELMIAMALTLVLVAAVLGIFQWVGDGVTKNRALIEGAGQLRSVSLRLQEDLESVTAPLAPWLDPAEELGYFEYVEGPLRDNTNAATDARFGDFDDILLFTARARGRPFLGRFNNGVIESEEAEILWWARPNDRNNDGAPESVTIHRRVLLIRPDLNGGNGMLAGVSAAAVNNHTFYQTNDLSVRIQGSGVAANSLGDLTKRENRTLHNPAAFPHVLNTNALQHATTATFVLAGTRLGEDVMLANALAFDIRGYDPYAQVGSAGAGANAVGLVPGDPGYPGSAAGFGAYVDLNYSGGSNRGTTLEHGLQFGPYAKSQLPTMPATYCTWSLHYELGGPGLDGLDNNNNGIVDDVTERVTSPPYPNPLRGLRVQVRLNEPSTDQIQQVTVVSSFVPE